MVCIMQRIQLNPGAWWGRERCLVQRLVRGICPRSVQPQDKTNCQSWDTILIGSNGGCDGGFPRWKSQFDSLKEPNIFHSQSQTVIRYKIKCAIASKQGLANQWLQSQATTAEGRVRIPEGATFCLSCYHEIGD